MTPSSKAASGKAKRPVSRWCRCSYPDSRRFGSRQELGFRAHRRDPGSRCVTALPSWCDRLEKHRQVKAGVEVWFLSTYEDHWLRLLATDNFEGTGQADKASSPNPATARSCVERLGLTAHATAHNPLALLRELRPWYQLLRCCIPPDNRAKSYAQTKCTDHDAPDSAATRCAGRWP
jgi:hypothetical protein